MTDPLLSICMFTATAIGMVLVGLTAGRLIRPRAPHGEKLAPYECGEPVIGPSWVQFDLRFYIVALFYLIFDVEVALIYPWAAIFREFPFEALVLGLPFLGIVIVGYAYEWWSGSLDWVRSAVHTARQTPGGEGEDMAQLARRDPDALADERGAA